MSPLQGGLRMLIQRPISAASDVTFIPEPPADGTGLAVGTEVVSVHA